MSAARVTLGERYRDTVTGFTGTATSEHRFLNGCVRYTLETGGEKPSDEPKELVFDEQRLVEADTNRAPAPPIDRRILNDVRAHGAPRWFEIEDRLDLNGDIDGLIQAWDARDRLVREGRVVEVQLPGCETRLRLPTVAELEEAFPKTPSGEAPLEMSA